MTHWYFFFADAIRQAAVTPRDVVTNAGPVLTTSQPLTTQVRITHAYFLRRTRKCFVGNVGKQNSSTGTH